LPRDVLDRLLLAGAEHDVPSPPHQHRSGPSRARRGRRHAGGLRPASNPTAG
jgi:hypothetical protein